MSIHLVAHAIVRYGAFALLAGIAVAAVLYLGWDADLAVRHQLAGNSASHAVMETLYRIHPGVLLLIGFGVGALLGILSGHFGWAQVVTLNADGSLR